jgi:hypothetical protein
MKKLLLSVMLVTNCACPFHKGSDDTPSTSISCAVILDSAKMHINNFIVYFNSGQNDTISMKDYYADTIGGKVSYVYSNGTCQSYVNQKIYMQFNIRKDNIWQNVLTDSFVVKEYYAHNYELVFAKNNINLSEISACYSKTAQNNNVFAKIYIKEILTDITDTLYALKETVSMKYE